MNFWNLFVLAASGFYMFAITWIFIDNLRLKRELAREKTQRGLFEQRISRYEIAIQSLPPEFRSRMLQKITAPKPAEILKGKR